MFDNKISIEWIYSKFIKTLLFNIFNQFSKDSNSKYKSEENEFKAKLY